MNKEIIESNEYIFHLDIFNLNSFFENEKEPLFSSGVVKIPSSLNLSDGKTNTTLGYQNKGVYFDEYLLVKLELEIDKIMSYLSNPDKKILIVPCKSGEELNWYFTFYNNNEIEYILIYDKDNSNGNTSSFKNMTPSLNMIGLLNYLRRTHV